MLWKGGMSFHGGLIGVIFATILFCKKNDQEVFYFLDLVCAASPIGIFFGRIANFINSELWGKTTSMPWGVIFTNAGPTPRHPSQLYEAALEGILIFFCPDKYWPVIEFLDLDISFAVPSAQTFPP